MAKKRKNKSGRPTIMSRCVVGKLEDAFSLGCTDEEASFHAGIHRSTLYDYEKSHPEFSDRKKALKLNPVLKARQTIFDNLDKPEFAKWYLERKVKAEFSPRTELSGANGDEFKGMVLYVPEEKKAMPVNKGNGSAHKSS